MIWLLVATARVSTILIVALALARVLGKRTASLRHMVLLIALMCAAVVPVLGAFVPTWAARTISVPSALQTLPIPLPRAVPGDMPIAPASAAEARVLESAAPVLTAAPAPSVRRWQASLPRILDVAWLVYIGGVVLSLAMLLLGLLQLHWMTARAVPMRGESWRRQAVAVASLYGLRRTVRLAHNQHVPVLAIWGVARPQVLLPAGAEDWSEDRIRAVLLHEFAHIGRNDWLTQVFAGVLRAIHWFNPFVWIVCASLRQESEQACDDAVLGHGVSGTEYAAHLLALARTFRQPAFMLASPPSMARRSTLLRRVAGILEPATVHAPASRMAVARVAVALLSVTLAVAACQIGQPLREADFMPPQSPGITHREVQPSAVTGPGPTVAADVRGDTRVVAVTRGLPKMLPPEIREAPVQAADAWDRTRPSALQTMAADITDFAQSVLAGGASSHAMSYEHLRGSMGSVLRTARRVIDDDARDPSGLATKATALLAALADAANSVANIDSRPGTARPDRQALQQLEAQLRARFAQLGAVLLPLPAVSSIVVSTPERRAAIAALDLAQTARADPSLGGWRPHASLLAGLDTLERAAQSVLVGDDADRDAAAGKLAALSTAILLTARVAANIGSRDVEPAETRSKATDLAGSLSAIAGRLGVASPASDDTRWLGWALPDTAGPPTASPTIATAALPDRSKPPLVVASADGFAIRRLAAPVVVDGRRWLAVNPIWGGTALASNRQFAVSLTDENDAGDAARYRLTYVASGGKPVMLTPDVVTYAMVTPDSRWIFLEQLDVIDVQRWRRYNLSRQFGITSYVVPKAISADGRYLVVSRSSCPFDCGNVPAEYYEIGFPEPDQLSNTN